MLPLGQEGSQNIESLSVNGKKHLVSLAPDYRDWITRPVLSRGRGSVNHRTATIKKYRGGAANV